MPCDAAGLGVVDFERGFWTELSFLDVEEVDVVGADVYAGEEKESISTLSVEPLGFVQWKPAEFRSNNPHKIAAHGQ